MANKTAKSIRSIFLHSQIIVSLTVLGIITAILTVLLLSLANYLDHRRIVELSQSIETQTRIAKNTQHLQHAITQIVHDNQATGIIIYGQNGDKIIAANSLPPSAGGNAWFLADKEVRKLVKNSLSTGVFGVQFTNAQQRRVSILPLAPPIVEDHGNNVILGTKWPTPLWHKNVKEPRLSLSELWHRTYTVFDPRHQHNFAIPANQYAGAIVTETNRDWITSLVIRGVIVMACLMALGIIIVVLVLSRVLHTSVLRPIRQCINVIAARRTGDLNARVPVANIIELDELAGQWNSLLDFRDVARGQNMVLSTLLEHVPVGIDVTDTESNIEYANPSFLKMTGYSLAEVIGKTPAVLLKSDKADPKILDESLAAITRGETWIGEMTYSCKDKSELICNTTLVPIFGRDNQIERLISVRLDITKLKQDQQTLITAKTNAETADKAKSEFLTNMSHELRTPLNAIIGFSELMAEQKLGPLGSTDYVEFSKLIETSSRTLLTSINLILDLSRFDAQRQQVNKTTFCLSELLNKLIESKTETARENGVELKRDLHCDHQICSDQRMLHQTLNSLICNAIRYNHEGGEVMVTVSEADGKVTVSIADTGIGISKEHLPQVTDPFFRVNSALDRMKDGAGLGLTLVKKFANEMGIDFNIASKLGKGTTATLTFPVAQSATATCKEPYRTTSDKPRKKIANT